MPLFRDAPGRVENVAVYIVLGVALEGHRDVLEHRLGDGAAPRRQPANFWLSVITDLPARGGEDIFIACIDGLTGFKEAIHAIFPQAEIQRCIIHQIRHSLQYVAWKDRKAFVADLKEIYQASTRTSCNWAKRGGSSTPLPASRGRTTGKIWPPSLITQPKFAG